MANKDILTRSHSLDSNDKHIIRNTPEFAKRFSFDETNAGLKAAERYLSSSDLLPENVGFNTIVDEPPRAAKQIVLNHVIEEAR